MQSDLRAKRSKTHSNNNNYNNSMNKQRYTSQLESPTCKQNTLEIHFVTAAQRRFIDQKPSNNASSKLLARCAALDVGVIAQSGECIGTRHGDGALLASDCNACLFLEPDDDDDDNAVDDDLLARRNCIASPGPATSGRHGTRIATRGCCCCRCCQPALTSHSSARTPRPPSER